MAETISQEKTIVVNKRQVLNIQINTFPADKQAVLVTYADGYDDADGKFIPVERGQGALAGEELVALLSQYPDLYDMLKEVSYSIAGK